MNPALERIIRTQATTTATAGRVGALSLISLALAFGCSGTSTPPSNAGGSAGAQPTGGQSNAGAPSGGTSAVAGTGGIGGNGGAACPTQVRAGIPCDISQAGNSCGSGTQCFSCTCISQQPGVACSYQVADCPSTQCVEAQGSCAQGETCCAGLMCCAGTPVPVGSEFCGTTCPRSDRALKRGFASVNEREVLERLSQLPISTWSYKTEGTEVRHLGPMAQDFKAAFGLGDSDRTILQVDADGVAFAAIQALTARLTALESTNRELAQRLRALETETQACGAKAATAPSR